MVSMGLEWSRQDRHNLRIYRDFERKCLLFREAGVTFDSRRLQLLSAVWAADCTP